VRYLVRTLLLLPLLACSESPTEPPESVSLWVEIMMHGSPATQIGLNVGVSVDLTAVVLGRNGTPLDPRPEVVFTSDQPTRIAVTSSGRVTAVDGGWAWVHARTTTVAARPDSVWVSAVRPLGPPLALR
jgi:hypothetical protein